MSLVTIQECNRKALVVGIDLITSPQLSTTLSQYWFKIITYIGCTIFDFKTKTFYLLKDCELGLQPIVLHYLSYMC